jgi:hypothetical protein
LKMGSLLRPFGGRAVPPSPPAVCSWPGDLDALISAIDDPWRPESQLRIYDELKAAADREWAWRALLAYATNPDRFVRRYLELRVEHSQPAELAADERKWFAGLVSARGIAHQTKEAKP